MPVHIWKPKGDRYFRYAYYFEAGDKKTFGSTRRADRQLAQRRADEIFREAQQERDGVLAPKTERDGLALPLRQHLEEYMTKLRGSGRAARYLFQVERYLLRLFEQCPWTFYKDVSPESFERWRYRQTLKAKTLNEYQSAASAFFSWLLKVGRIPRHPLVSIEKAKAKGYDPQERRAFTPDELSRLLNVAGDRAIVYQTAAYSGLRRGELCKLEWRDLFLDVEKPYVCVRASTAKNEKKVSLPLHPDVASGLRALRSRGGDSVRVFYRIVPEMELFKKHLALAGIPFKDERGKKADFHSLRNTFATILTLNGTPQREIMELMRHSDMRLTAKVYTDAGQLPLAKTVNALPSLKRGAQIVAQKSVFKVPNVSSTVQAGNSGNTLEALKTKGSVTVCPPQSNFVEKVKWCTRQDSNLKPSDP